MQHSAIAVRAVRRLVETDPAAAARFLCELSVDEAAKVLVHLPPDSSGRCFKRMPPADGGPRLAAVPAVAAAAILEALEPQEAADVFRSMTKESQQALVEALSPEKRRDLQEYLQYPEGSAGRLMTTDFVVFPVGLPIKEAIKRLRHAIKEGRGKTYTYIVDADGRLAGVINMRDLAIAEGTAPVETAMVTVAAAVTGFTDREEVLQLVRGKNFLSVPVVDAERRLLGVVRAGDLVQSAREEGAEDLQVLFGVSEDETAHSPWLSKVKHRLPWLNVNLATAFLAGSVVSMYEDLIARISVLAIFLPIIAGQGGNAGAQTLAVILRGIVMREVKFEHAREVLAREAFVGLANGAFVGAVAGLAAWAWKGNPWLGLVVALAMISNLLAATIAGAAIPLTLKRMNMDPAQSSTIFLTTVTDVVGFFSLLGFAAVFERYLL